MNELVENQIGYLKRQIKRHRQIETDLLLFIEKKTRNIQKYITKFLKNLNNLGIEMDKIDKILEEIYVNQIL